MAASDHVDLRETEAARRAALERREEAVQSREDTAQLREEAVGAREWSVGLRERAAADRDRAAGRRDAAADGRDRDSDDRDRARAEAAERVLASTSDLTLKDELAGAATDRTHAAGDRVAAADDRAAAGQDRVAAAADRAALGAQLEQDAYDDLTGAFRRGPGLATLRRYLAMATRTEQTFVVAFVDVVGLKQINDGEGHDAGDRALRTVARVLRANMRSYDAVVRFGGDEFVAALLGVSSSAAQHRLRVIIGELAERGVGVTIGFAERDGDSTLEDLITRADGHLLEQRAATRTP